MRKAKQERIQAAGWKVGSAGEFLGLDAGETALVELRLELGRLLRARRTARRMSQAELAQTLGSSQSRVAKMEAADASVSIDLLLRSLLAMDAEPKRTAKSLARALGGVERTRRSSRRAVASR